MGANSRSAISMLTASVATATSGSASVGVAVFEITNENLGSRYMEPTKAPVKNRQGTSAQSRNKGNACSAVGRLRKVATSTKYTNMYEMGSSIHLRTPVIVKSLVVRRSAT